MARTNTGLECGGNCHRHGSIVSYEVHHVWPLGYHGPDEAWNKARICCNAHSDTHYLLERMLKGKPYEIREYSIATRRLAQLGYDRIMAYGDELANKVAA